MVGCLWLKEEQQEVGKNPKPNQVKLAVKKLEISLTFSLLSHTPISESCSASGAGAGSPQLSFRAQRPPSKQLVLFCSFFWEESKGLWELSGAGQFTLLLAWWVRPQGDEFWGFGAQPGLSMTIQRNQVRGQQGWKRDSLDPFIHPLSHKAQKGPAKLSMAPLLEKPSKAVQSNFPQPCQGHH